MDPNRSTGQQGRTASNDDRWLVPSFLRGTPNETDVRDLGLGSNQDADEDEDEDDVSNPSTGDGSQPDPAVDDNELQNTDNVPSIGEPTQPVSGSEYAPSSSMSLGSGSPGQQAGSGPEEPFNARPSQDDLRSPLRTGMHGIQPEQAASEASGTSEAGQDHSGEAEQWAESIPDFSQPYIVHGEGRGWSQLYQEPGSAPSSRPLSRSLDSHILSTPNRRIPSLLAQNARYNELARATAAPPMVDSEADQLPTINIDPGRTVTASPSVGNTRDIRNDTLGQEEGRPSRTPRRSMAPSPTVVHTGAGEPEEQEEEVVSTSARPGPTRRLPLENENRDQESRWSPYGRTRQPGLQQPSGLSRLGGTPLRTQRDADILERSTASELERIIQQSLDSYVSANSPRPAFVTQRPERPSPGQVDRREPRQPVGAESTQSSLPQSSTENRDLQRRPSLVPGQLRSGPIRGSAPFSLRSGANQPEEMRHRSDANRLPPVVPTRGNGRRLDQAPSPYIRDQRPHPSNPQQQTSPYNNPWLQSPHPQQQNSSPYNNPWQQQPRPSNRGYGHYPDPTANSWTEGQRPRIPDPLEGSTPYIDRPGHRPPPDPMRDPGQLVVPTGFGTNDFRPTPPQPRGQQPAPTGFDVERITRRGSPRRRVPRPPPTFNLDDPNEYDDDDDDDEPIGVPSPPPRRRRRPSPAQPARSSGQPPAILRTPQEFRTAYGQDFRALARNSNLATVVTQTNENDPDPGQGYDKKRKFYCRMDPQHGYQICERREGPWRNAIRHDDIRGTLLAHAATQGTFRPARARGPEPGDVTSFHPYQQGWDANDRDTWPPVLFRLERTDFTPPLHCSEPVGDWMWGDRFIVDRDNRPLQEWHLLNTCCSSQFEGMALEALCRLCSKMQPLDIWQRTPDVRKGRTALNARRNRFRDYNGLITWIQRPNSKPMKDATLRKIGQWGRDNNSTKEFVGFTKAEVQRIKGNNRRSAAAPAPPESEPEEDEQGEADVEDEEEAETE